MAAKDLSVDERYKYLRRLQQQYRQADRTTKSRLLDQACSMLGLHRKYAIACLNKPNLQRHRRSRSG